MEHEFTSQISRILQEFFGDDGIAIYERSPLLQYLNIKTRSASRGSKSRGSFGSIYTIYVLIEDYLKNNFDTQDNWADYGGARYTDLLARLRELPFGRKLQNHAFNNRLDGEFKKYFSQVGFPLIIHDARTSRYWIHENLLKISDRHKTFNIARAAILIIDRYIETKQSAFRSFIATCKHLQIITDENDVMISEFIESLIAPNSDARIFEIVSYSILRYYYYDQIVYLGFDLDSIHKESLVLYKTGRTNANDGGIDFVMRPLGRFFQVTETVNVKKYFLDIDNIEHFPITFVIKSTESIDILLSRLQNGAKKQYGVNQIVDRYMQCIEEVINIPILLERFLAAKSQGYLRNILDEIILQSKVEFNFDDLEPE